MSTRGPLSHTQQRTDFKTATALLCIAVSFIICQSVKIIPDIYELRNCNYLKVILQLGWYIALKDWFRITLTNIISNTLNASF